MALLSPGVWWASRVRAAFRPISWRSPAVRCRDWALAWRESAVEEAACFPSRCNALVMARERVGLVFGFFQFSLSSGRQALAGPVDEELDHTDPGADALGADLLAGHRPGDSLGVLGKQALRGRGGYRLHTPNPFLLFRHDFSSWALLR